MSVYVAHRESAREWWDYAACSRMNPSWWDSEAFVPDKNVSLENLAAIRTCLDCSVRWKCLGEAVEIGGEHTIRGGYFPSEQKQLANNLPVRSRPIVVLEKLMKVTSDVDLIVKQAHQILTNRGKMLR